MMEREATPSHSVNRKRGRSIRLRDPAQLRPPFSFFLLHPFDSHGSLSLPCGKERIDSQGFGVERRLLPEGVTEKQQNSVKRK
jgi:hypothetical protein